jgi:hypothetical protein
MFARPHLALSAVNVLTWLSQWTEAFLPDCLRTDMNRFGLRAAKGGGAAAENVDRTWR